jgi:hypothetical protein
LVLFSLAVIPPVYTADALHAAAQVPPLDPDEDPDDVPDPDDEPEPDEDPDEPEEPDDPDDPVLLPETSVQSEGVVGVQPVPL